MEPTHEPQQPGPSLWPIGFAIGLACVLVGLIVSWPAVVVGAVIAALSAALWIRDATRGSAAAVVHEPETRAPAGPAPPADAGPPAMPVMDEDEVERYPRNVFLSTATLGIGGAIAGIVTVPAVGFMIAPAFVGQGQKKIDLGPLEKFPEGQWAIVNFFRDPSQGDVARRTAYVRNNGAVNGSPSFTIISNRCAHLGCPVQPNGPVSDKRSVENFGKPNEVTIREMEPAGFGCPCHGGQYDTEGNRTAGPPVRALDRYDFEIVDQHLVLIGTYSVGNVVGEGAGAKIKRYNLQGPGQPVEGAESWLYPVQAPH